MDALSALFWGDWRRFELLLVRVQASLVMRQRDQETLEFIAQFEPDAFEDEEGQEALVERVQEMQDPKASIHACLELFERHPDADFGMPGPIVHFLESFFGRGYEAQLLLSTARCPTSHTVWMLHRVARGCDRPERAERYFDELRRIAKLEGEPGAQARDFLQGGGDEHE